MNDYTIIHVMDHYEVYVNGEFICSEDTYGRAVKEIEKYLTERK